MTPAELRTALTSTESVQQRPFELLREICRLRNSGFDSQVTQELVLRALEHRASLGPAAVLLDGLVRDVGLFPYLEPEALGAADRLAYEIHRPPALDKFVFHHPQAKVFHTLMSGKSVVLSAPTSFGKSLIIDAIVASGRFRNVVIVVPTLALIDETRRRLSQLKTEYAIITQSFQRPRERNVFVMTQERVLDSAHITEVDFFVIDEFYKLNPGTEDDERSASLNHVFYQLSKKCSHFYLLGPGIRELSEEFREALRFEFFHEPFHTVVSELHRVAPGKRPLEKLRELAAELSEPTLVFCSSPDRAKTVSASLPAGDGSVALDEASDWLAEHYHPGWHLVASLRRGIGIHHGRVPRAIAQYIVRAFNEGEAQLLVCTSTLIEGVNTSAKNIIVYDHKINKQAIDLFTFNNIRGRSGRMFKHFVGHVYVFHEPPQEGLPFIDVPAFTQGASASDALLVQIPAEDLSDEADARVAHFRDHVELPFEVIQANVGVSPEAQIALAEELAADSKAYSRRLAWSNVPRYPQLLPICELIWTFFGGSKLGSGSARTAKQLTMMLLQLMGRPTTRELVEKQLPYCNNDPDQAVRVVLDFQRLWAMFHFPRLLRAIGRIQEVVFAKRGLPVGSYEYFASLVEHLCLSPAIVALEEYGIPLPLGRKLEHYVGKLDDLDVALAQIRSLDLDKLALSEFERTLLEDARSAM